MLPQVNALIVLFQAPSTRIRIFLNPQVFLSGFKNSALHVSVLKSNLPVHMYPSRMRIHSTGNAL